MGLAGGRCCPSPTCLGAGDDGDDVGGVEPMMLALSWSDLDHSVKGRGAGYSGVIREGEGLDYILKCNDYLHQSLLMKPFGGGVGVAFAGAGVVAGFAVEVMRPRRALISTAGASLVARLV